MLAGSGTGGSATANPEVLPWVKPSIVECEVAENTLMTGMSTDEVYPKAPAPPPKIVSALATTGAEAINVNVRLYRVLISGAFG